MAFFTTDDGVRLFYKDTGGGGRTVLFVHGLMDSHVSFAARAGVLAAKHRLVMYDQRGHGQSDVPEDGYVMARMAQDLKNLIDHLQLSNIVLIGYSMGVHVIFDYIRQFGEEGIDKLVLSVMSPRLITDESYTLGYNGGFSAGDVLQTLHTFSGAFPMLRGMGVAAYTGHEKYKEQVRAYFESTSTLQTGPILRLYLAVYTGDYWPVYESITKPTLVISGEDDIFSFAAREEMHKRLASSQLCIIPDSGHLVLAERPEEYLAALDEFIDNKNA